MSEQAKTYNISKTLSKGGIPIAVMVLVKIAVSIANSQGITIDEATALTIAMGGYGVVIGFINWLKNRKKKEVK